MQETLKKMVELHGDGIYRLALRYTGNRSLAQDITQETFLRACSSLESYDHSRPAGPWLLTIATNLCRNLLRDNREIPTDFNENLYHSDKSNPEKLYIDKEGEEELMQALNRLPLKYREVILLKHVNELSYSEICKILGLDLSLVKNRLFRGRKMLREALLKKGGTISAEG